MVLSGCAMIHLIGKRCHFRRARRGVGRACARRGSGLACQAVERGYSHAFPLETSAVPRAARRTVSRRRSDAERRDQMFEQTPPYDPKSVAIFLAGVVAIALPVLAQTEVPAAPAAQNITIPHNDSQYKATRGYIEDTPMPGLSTCFSGRLRGVSGFEVWRSDSLGHLLHLEETHTSWPFLKMSYAKKAGIQRAL